MAVVTAPVAGFTGVVVGVSFIDGAAEATDDAQIAYFERQGYKVEFPSTEPKSLDEQSKAELEATATAEGVEYGNPINKPELAALIQAKRAE